MQIVSIGGNCMKSQIQFSAKNKKTYFNTSYAILFICFIFNRFWHFMQILFNEDDLHDMSDLVFSEKLEK